MFKLYITGECSALNRTAILHSPKGSVLVLKTGQSNLRAGRWRKVSRDAAPSPGMIATETVNTQQLSIPA